MLRSVPSRQGQIYAYAGKHCRLLMTLPKLLITRLYKSRYRLITSALIIEKSFPNRRSLGRLCTPRISSKRLSQILSRATRSREKRSPMKSGRGRPAGSFALLPATRIMRDREKHDCRLRRIDPSHVHPAEIGQNLFASRTSWVIAHAQTDGKGASLSIYIQISLCARHAPKKGIVNHRCFVARLPLTLRRIDSGRDLMSSATCESEVAAGCQ